MFEQKEFSIENARDETNTILFAVIKPLYLLKNLSNTLKFPKGIRNNSQHSVVSDADVGHVSGLAGARLRRMPIRLVCGRRGHYKRKSGPSQVPGQVHKGNVANVTGGTVSDASDDQRRQCRFVTRTTLNSMNYCIF